jgi:ribulose-5-phosphate 4-epimerase/fuculose-1-phosphate aldolase
MSKQLDIAVSELLSANKILGHEGILDAYGHVSVRHPNEPDHFLLSRARSPEVIEPADVLEFDLSGSPVGRNSEALYIERFIHAAFYELRSDVNAVCHNHTLSVLPFSISAAVHLRAVIHSARFLGSEVPVWDIADEFGAGTDMLVRNMDQGRSLTRSTGHGNVVLMRGHGSVVAGPNLRRVVSMCIGMDRNAKVMLDAYQMGEVVPLHAGEISGDGSLIRGGNTTDDRAWEYFQRRAGII